MSGTNGSEERGTSRPSFWAPLLAALRQGAKEFAQLLPAFRDSIQPIEEPGTLGNPTPQMLTEEMGTLKGYNLMLDRYSSKGNERKEPEQGMER